MKDKMVGVTSHPYPETHMSDTFQDFTRQVGEWSDYNFGDQKGIGAFAPFAGIVEEIGELSAASEVEDILDAYADIAVYFADFCYRSKLELNLAWSLEDDDQLIGFLTLPIKQAIGDLAHVLLKTHQGIRHYEDVEFAKAQLTRTATVFWYSLIDDFETDHQLRDESFHETVWKTWNRVKQRDWKSDPRTANQVVEDAVEDVQASQPFGDWLNGEAV